MSNQSKIEWTDATWNPVRGCTKISPGCKNCYAETFAERFRGVTGHPYEQGFDLRLVPEKLKEPFHWKKPKRIFVNSMSDLFQEGVPFEYIDKVFAMMALCHWHTFQVLTKRADRMKQFLLDENRPAGILNDILSIKNDCSIQKSTMLPLKNVVVGVSVENQDYANSRIPGAIIPLLDAGWNTMISCEPLLGPIRFKLVPGFNRVNISLRRLWVIVGGESGHGARPCEASWVRSLVGQCHISKVKCFVKQMGGYVVDSNDAGFDGNDGIGWPAVHMEENRVEDLDSGYQGAPVRVHLKSRKGGDPLEWPEDLRVREYPEAINA